MPTCICPLCNRAIEYEASVASVTCTCGQAVAVPAAGPAATPEAPPALAPLRRHRTGEPTARRWPAALVVGLAGLVFWAMRSERAKPALVLPSPAPAEISALRWRFAYEAEGPTSIVDPAGRETRIRRTRDAKGRVTQVDETRPDGTTVVTTFDAAGRRGGMTDAAGSIRYGYDANGRLASAERAGQPALALAHDDAGRVTSVKIGTEFEVRQAYDFTGRLKRLTVRADASQVPGDEVKYTYRPADGRAIRELPGSRIQSIRANDPGGKLASLEHTTADTVEGGRRLVRFAFAHRPDGLTRQVAEDGASGTRTVDYEYDRFHRVTAATAAGRAPGSYRYAYDALGNRVSAVTPAGTVESAFDWAGRLVRHRGEAATSDLAGGVAGVPRARGSLVAVHGSRGALARADAGRGIVNYRYDGAGRLVAREVAGRTTTYLPDPEYPGWHPLLAVDADGRRTYFVWEGNALLATFSGAEVRYYLADDVASARVAVDREGDVVERLDYEPFGAPLAAPASSELVPGFAGLLFDPVVELYVTAGRAYDPALGQFLTRDPERSTPTGAAESLSAYAYCGSDPVNFLDVQGTTRSNKQNPNETTRDQLEAIAFLIRQTGTQVMSTGPNSRQQQLSVNKGEEVMKDEETGKMRRPDLTLGGQATVNGAARPAASGYEALNGLIGADQQRINTVTTQQKTGPVDQRTPDQREQTAAKHIQQMDPDTTVHMINKLTPEDVYKAQKANPTEDPNTVRANLIAQNAYSSFQHLVQSQPGGITPAQQQALDDAKSQIVDKLAQKVAVWQQQDNYGKSDRDVKAQQAAAAADPGKVGGIYLKGAAGALSGLGQLKGVSLDASGRLVLLTQTKGEVPMPPLKIEDMAVLFRCTYESGLAPYVSIDPDPADPEGPWKKVRHSPATKKTYVGWVMFEADRMMKTYVVGRDNVTGLPFRSTIPGQQRIMDLQALDIEERVKRNLPRSNTGRFWIVPQSIKRAQTPGDPLVMFDVPLGVETETLLLNDNGELEDAPIAGKNPACAAAAEWLTEHMDDVARECTVPYPPESGLTGSVHVFAELKRIAVVAAVAERLRDQGVPMPSWMRDYPVPIFRMPQRTPRLQHEMDLPGGRGKIAVSGGTVLSPPTTHVVDVPADAAAPALSSAVLSTLAATPTGRKVEVASGDASFDAVALPGNATQALGALRLTEEDLVVPVQGASAVVLRRSYNSFFAPRGLYGLGWSADLPVLDLQRRSGFRTNRTDGRAEVGFQLTSALNSFSARFDRKQEGQALVKPEHPGPYLGVAPQADLVPNASALKLADGREWHFHPGGWLSAMREGPFVLRYERKEPADDALVFDPSRPRGEPPLVRLEGRYGQKPPVTIEVESDARDRIVRAAAAGFGEVTYAYDDADRLVRVKRADGTWDYAYAKGLLESISHSGKLVRRFEYDEQGALTGERDADGRPVDYASSMNAAGTTFTQSTPSGKRTAEYDVQMRPLARDLDGGGKVSWKYAADGGQAMTIAGAGGAVLTVEESADRRSQTWRAPGGDSVSVRYDEAGRQTELKRGDRVVQSTEFDDAGRVKSVTVPGTAVRPQYAEDGQLKQLNLVPPGGADGEDPGVEVDFDAAGRPAAMRQASGGKMTETMGLTYDDQDRPVEIKTGRGSYKLTRDAAGRVVAAESSWGEKEEHRYDADGRLTRSALSRGGAQQVTELVDGVTRIHNFDGGELAVSYFTEGATQGRVREIQTPEPALRLAFQYSDRQTVVQCGAVRSMSVTKDPAGRIVEMAEVPGQALPAPVVAATPAPPASAAPSADGRQQLDPRGDY